MQLAAKFRLARAVVLGCAIMACADFRAGSAQEAERVRLDSIRLDSLVRDSVGRVDSIARADSIALADSLARVDSMRRADSLRAARAAATPSRTSRATDSVPWPALPPVRPGAVVPGSRVVAYYGNPLSRRMGVLGEYPRDEMIRRLEETVAEWAEADSATPVRAALHMIVTVAQASAGRDGKYRLRMTDSVINRVAQWAEQRGWLFFVDVQVGLSTVEAELPRLTSFLERPYVHLALDPEFAMKDGTRPGRKIGTMDAAEINRTIRFLADIVERNKLPPKMLVVHRFTERMLTNADQIVADPRVQVIIDMDGFGAPQLKRSTWRHVIQNDPVQYAGFKLFYKNDKPMLTPRQVIDLFPSPVYIQYQ